MSNYAPDPMKEQVYTNLQNFKLGNVGANDIQKLTDPTFLQATNQDALLTYNIINQSAMRDGSPMPEKMQVTATSTSESGTAVEVLTPQKGEVWEIYTGQAVVTSPSGSVIHEFTITDNNNSRTILVYYQSSSSSSILLGQDSDWKVPFRLDSNCTLKYEATGTFSNSQLLLQMTRIR